MKMSTPVFLVAAALVLCASACKRDQPAEPSAAAEEPAAASIEDEAIAEEQTGETPVEEAAIGDGRTLQTMAVPEDWITVSAKTPKGATVSLGVPNDWVEGRPPNESTHLVRVAPAGTPAAGTQVTIVTREFAEGRTELADFTRGRLEGFASIRSEGPIRVGAIDAFEFAAAWSTPIGSRETVQLLVATGKEAIGVTCSTAPGQLDSLSGLCDELFATLSIKGAEALK